ncbi:hypothetical protein XNW1_4190017 [Xenorhabdus nematophila str. Websteri]|nr:hypothetical protein XNA1_1590017 [Xenorhabdus nematophila str. Anatoliense]CEE91328.1 hypothetical protein XNA1_2040017 [Xenorhabdus nematophila str. Anatoliense]CEF28732.1 hypothetical protein XNW1_1350017 [Xenorhabdus nematophila str. Websteri]CEF31988.1 hypothetical protein XNW1_4190017 [Xenorhabdus nematophila str. Websteri]
MFHNTLQLRTLKTHFECVFNKDEMQADFYPMRIANVRRLIELSPCKWSLCENWRLFSFCYQYYRRCHKFRK